MLEEYIKQQLNNIQEKGEDNSTESLNKAQKRLNEVIQKIYKDSPDLAEEVDSIGGELASAYADMYFTLGFKKGLRLINEIKEV